MTDRRRRWPAIALLAALAASAARAQGIERAEGLVLENRQLRLVFDRGDGRLLAFENLARGLSLMPEGTTSPPPRVTAAEAADPRIVGFSHRVLEESAARQLLELRWELERGVGVVVRAELEAGAELARLWPTVTNAGELVLSSLFYPEVPLLATLGEAQEDDVLVHAFVRGTWIRDPKRSLDIPHNPIAEARYPQAYNGMTHQLLDYYEEGRGGFFFAAFDPHVTEKTVAMPVGDGELGMSWRHHQWDMRPGRGLELDFAFVLGANVTGDWYRAADLYREWALTADWCPPPGANARRREEGRAAWLFEEVGLATFGTAARVDQSAWYQAYHDVAGGRVLHVTGVDAVGHAGRDGDPFDLDVALHPRNLATLERNGDSAAIFLPDLNTSFLAPEIAWEVGRLKVSVVPRPSPEACPGSRFWRLIHAARSARALERTGADSSYHDASAPNRGLQCESLEHGHPPGRGRWMNDLYRELYAGTRRALETSCGRATPMGVELMHEGLLESFDYYQARNGAGFMGTLEGGFYRGLQLRGLARTLPVFGYLYHDLGPVALDGCGKLSERLGDVFYWMAGRVALRGDIFEVNNEFSPTERFPGVREVGLLQYRNKGSFDRIPPGSDVDSPYDPRKGEFVRELALARTGYARDFLAYGRMLPPLPAEAPPIDLSWSYYNNIDWGGRPNSLRFADESGEIATPSLLHTAWRFEDRLGLVFLNLDAAEREFEVHFDLARYRAYGLGIDGELRGERVERGGRTPFSVTAGERRRLRLPPRRIVLIELRTP